MIRKAAKAIITVSWQMILCILVIIVLYHAGVYGYEFGKEIFAPTPVSIDQGKDMIVIVEEDATSADVAKLLESKGLIRDWRVFYVQAFLYQAQIEPGSYTLNTSMTSQDILDIMKADPVPEDGENL